MTAFAEGRALHWLVLGHLRAVPGRSRRGGAGGSTPLTYTRFSRGATTRPRTICRTSSRRTVPGFPKNTHCNPDTSCYDGNSHDVDRPEVRDWRACVIVLH